MGNHAMDRVQYQSKSSERYAGFKPLGMMAVCCIVPLAVALLLKQFGYTGAASYLILFLCPILHLFMMRGMFSYPTNIQADNKNQHHPGGTHG